MPGLSPPHSSAAAVARITARPRDHRRLRLILARRRGAAAPAAAAGMVAAAFPTSVVCAREVELVEAVARPPLKLVAALGKLLSGLRIRYHRNVV